MKLTKTTSGKQTVKISKSDWESIGKSAGWMKQAGEISDWETDSLSGLHNNYSNDTSVTQAPEQAEKERQKAVIRKVARPLINNLPPEIQAEFDRMPEAVENREFNMQTAAQHIAKKLRPIIQSSPEFEAAILDEYKSSFEKLDDRTRNQIIGRIVDYCRNVLIDRILKAIKRNKKGL